MMGIGLALNLFRPVDPEQWGKATADVAIIVFMLALSGFPRHPR
jgi:hypothetical protein